eukprot:scaffold9134_cov170-Amphora_coffeaeformis.AAC.7
MTVYDRLVERRQQLVLRTAEKSNAIVTSLFPSQVRDRLMENADVKKAVTGTKTKIRSFLDGNKYDENKDMKNFMYKTQPIAEFFAESSVMFGDIEGVSKTQINILNDVHSLVQYQGTFRCFSVSKVQQCIALEIEFYTSNTIYVCKLLETLYKAFDEIATRRKVFKVETVGDCYVAVAGVPDARKDHAVIMARFAADCMRRMNALTKKLEKILGPDTADLRMRIGLHSGPVTAGVLRGERSRFQLFGDTMNTAARIESTSFGNKIQVSQETADLIAAAGKRKWLSQRKDIVVAKGKGALQTFWLNIDGSRDDNKSESGASDETHSIETTSEGRQTKTRMLEEKTRRLIDWNVDVLKRLLKEIVAWRQASRKGIKTEFVPEEESDARGQTVIDEVSEIISLPQLNGADATFKQNVDAVCLSEAAETQLDAFVSSIAALYRENPFHNFEHASHVTMSVGTYYLGSKK